MTNPATAAVDLMRREFFSEFPPPDDLDIFALTDWDDLPPTEKMAWLKAFTFAYKIGMTGISAPTLNKEKLAEAVDLCIAILDDLETETEYPTVTTGMAYRAALDNAQQLLDTLQQATPTVMHIPNDLVATVTALINAHKRNDLNSVTELK